MTWFSASPLAGSTFFGATGPNSIEAILNDLSGQAQLQNFRNIVGRNGQFAVWQRGTSISVAASTTAYTADGWYLQTGASQAHTVARSATSSSIGTILYAVAIQRNNTQNGTSQVYFEFPIDSDELIKLRGNKVIVTFYAVGSTGFSGGSGGTVTANLYVGTGSPAKRGGSAYTGETNPISFASTIAANNIWAQYTSAVSGVVATSTTQAALQFTWTPSGTAGASDILYLAAVHLQAVSPNLTPIVPAFELTDFMFDYQRCLQHYQKSFPYTTAPAQNTGNDAGASQYVAAGTTGGGGAWVPFFPPMRASPGTTTFYNPAAANALWRDLSGATDNSAVVVQDVCEKGMFITNASVSFAGHLTGVHWTADASI